MIYLNFDWKTPDYTAVFERRVRGLARMRAAIAEERADLDATRKAGRTPGPETVLPDLKLFYRGNIPQFISDWGCTFDPRNVELGLPSVIPFVLFSRQEEWVWWLLDRWHNREPGLCDKSRESGLSWLAVSTASALCILNDGMAIGFGSRKEEYVDRRGDMKSLFEKNRRFVGLLPKEFRAGWNLKDCAHMRQGFPETGSTITGEAGDNIGRGDRQSIYIVDESAFIEHPDLVDASLSQTTNCRIDISTPNGSANSFARKRHSMPTERIFTFSWRDDPRKGPDWYAKQLVDIDDPVIVAQEIDIDYAASIEGVVIPAAWARAAVDAHIKLGISISGARRGALDVADEGKDANAFAGAHGPLVEFIKEWSGKGSDTFQTTETAFELCDDNEYEEFRYDADGIGALVRGDARVINARRKEKSLGPQIRVTPIRGSEAVHNPEGQDVKGRKNVDYFKNRKSQSWWRLRVRFRNTFRALAQAQDIAAGRLQPHEYKHFDPDEMIFISSKCGNCAKLVSELSQATYQQDTVGKLVIDKTPEGARSPNMADAVKDLYAPGKSALAISDDALAAI